MGLGGAGAQEHVVGFEVAVDDPARVRRGHRLRDLSPHGEREHAIARQPQDAAQVSRERLTLEVFHDDERVAVDHVAVEHLDDAGVTDRRRRARLGEEALDDARVRRQLRQQHLDGGAPLDAVMLREIDPSHPALPQLLDDFESAGELGFIHRERVAARFVSPLRDSGARLACPT